MLLKQNEGEQDVRHVLLDSVNFTVSVYHKYIYIDFVVADHEETLVVDIKEALTLVSALRWAVKKITEVK